MINKRPFPPAFPRRAAVAGGNLPNTTGNYQNLTGYDIGALAAALQACGISCAPGAGPTPQQIAVIAAQAQASQPQRCRRTIMGLAKVVVAAGPGPFPLVPTTAQSSTQPQAYAFRGLRLMVPTDISPAGDLRSATIATQQQTMLAQVPAGGNADIPLRTFDQTSQDSGFIDMDWCPTTNQVDLVVTNKTAAPYVFEGSLEGLQLL